jgi:predicted ATPase
MLGTVPEYAAERLAESGEEEAIRERHALFFRDLAEASFPQMYSPGRTAWIESLKADHGNLLAALAWRSAGSVRSGRWRFRWR